MGVWRPSVNSLDVPGLMARTVVDLASYLKILAGWDPLDSTSLQLQLGEAHEPLDDRLCIGVPQEYVCEGMSEEVIGCLSHVCDIFESKGCRNCSCHHFRLIH
jgi:aspartyl-tRNA(Asn)/glutamyl-tRNA(Gln) amidotransferase subunit A